MYLSRYLHDTAADGSQAAAPTPAASTTPAVVTTTPATITPAPVPVPASSIPSFDTMVAWSKAHWYFIAGGALGLILLMGQKKR